MKFLVDQNRSPRLPALLCEAGHDAVHTFDLGLERAEDDDLLLLARDEGRVVVTGDTDFGALLALSHERFPSVILFRRSEGRSAVAQASLILEHLDDLADDLAAGSLAVVRDDRIRVRRLPLLPKPA